MDFWGQLTTVHIRPVFMITPSIEIHSSAKHSHCLYRNSFDVYIHPTG